MGDPSRETSPTVTLWTNYGWTLDGTGKPIAVAGLWGCNRATTIIKEIIMETLTELKKFDAMLRMTRFSTKRKGNEKKRLSKKACRKKVRI